MRLKMATRTRPTMAIISAGPEDVVSAVELASTSSLAVAVAVVVLVSATDASGKPKEGTGGGLAAWTLALGIINTPSMATRQTRLKLDFL